jgi:predicted metal-dependent hydrolase
MSNQGGGTRQAVECGGERIEFRLRRSQRKTLAITVRPDTSVVVTVPLRADLLRVMARVKKRAAWIRRQRRYFERFLPAQLARQYVSGETHRYLGRQYRLKVVRAAKASVKLKGRFIRVERPEGAKTGWVKRMVEAWYLERARAAFGRSLEVCRPALHGQVKGTPRLQLRRMPKRWGSWTQRGVIYLNPELVRAPGSCIDYVVTHELCHLVYGDHGRNFFELLRRVMPDWEQRKARLEAVMAE